MTREQYLQSYIDFVPKVHEVYPDAQIILMSLWKRIDSLGNSWAQKGAYIDEIYQVYKTYEDEGYVHYFNSTGILQHNDFGPQFHPTDVGHVKVRIHGLAFSENANFPPKTAKEIHIWPKGLTLLILDCESRNAIYTPQIRVGVWCFRTRGAA